MIRKKNLQERPKSALTPCERRGAKVCSGVVTLCHICPIENSVVKVAMFGTRCLISYLPINLKILRKTFSIWWKKDLTK